MKLSGGVNAFFASVSLFSGLAHAQYCGPTSFTGNQFPKGNFFSNFYNPCYLIPFATGSGATESGDLNAIYAKIIYKVNPAYQLIIVGQFDNSRYMSITNYDAHSAPAQFVLDQDIAPLTSSYSNPYLPGSTYVPGQKYAVALDFGGTPGTQQKGCMMTGYNLNELDATQRHAGMDWNSDPYVWKVNPNFTYHIVDTPQHTNPNTAGETLVRNYLDISTAPSATYAILRDVASGCAYPAAYAAQVLQVVTSNQNIGNPWLDTNQADLHRIYANDYLDQVCYAKPANMAVWVRPGLFRTVVI